MNSLGEVGERDKDLLKEAKRINEEVRRKELFEKMQLEKVDLEPDQKVKIHRVVKKLGESRIGVVLV